MIRKGKRPGNTLHEWQVKAYSKRATTAPVDGTDVESYNHTARTRLSGRVQLFREAVQVSTLADKRVTDVAGVPEGEMAAQIADGLVTLKQTIERKLLSADDCLADDGATHGSETRGGFSWTSTSAQTLLPVPEDYRPPSASVYSGAMASLTEQAFQGLVQSWFKQRRAAGKWLGLVGIELKQQMSNWSVWQQDATGIEIRRFNQDAKSKAVISVIDKLVMDGGEIDLVPSAYLYCTRATGEDSDYTHKSGLFLDMDMMELAWTDLPKARKLEDRGGGPRALIEGVGTHICHNPRACGQSASST
jgi:hypothetical protein